MKKHSERLRLIAWAVIFIFALIALACSRHCSGEWVAEWAIWLFLLLSGGGMLAIVLRREMRRERELARSHKLLGEYRRLVDESAYVSKTDLQGVITYVNDRFCEISGFSREELIGAPHSIVRHPDMKAEVFEQMWQTLQSGQVWRGIIKNKNRSGEGYFVDSVVAPIFDEQGEVSEYMALRYDVTALEKALAEAKEAKEAKDRFLANMSHEIRTPLNAILGFVELLSDRIKNDETAAHYVRTIGRNGQTLLGIINDVLDFAKIESGKVELHKSPCDLKAEVESVVELFKANAGAKGVHLDEVWCEPFPACVVTDPLRVRQILGNLLSNAIKFTPSGRRVTIKASHKPQTQKIEFAVSDQGIGIPSEWQNRIFEAFTQVRSTDASLHGGTGLGLSISQALARELGGALALRSELGKGATFVVTLPARECEAARQTAAKAEGFSGNQRRILVAEDQADNQLVIRLFLEKMDFQVQIVSDGQEALGRFCGEPYDLVLLDENMPHLNGTQTLKQMRAWEKRWNKKPTPIAVLTANAVKGDRERFLAEGFDDYLSKPILKPALAALLQRLITKG
ncbi:MAG: ATP-binding protein [Campylobacterales bacterium]